MQIHTGHFLHNTALPCHKNVNVHSGRDEHKHRGIQVILRYFYSDVIHELLLSIQRHCLICLTRLCLNPFRRPGHVNVTRIF